MSREENVRQCVSMVVGRHDEIPRCHVEVNGLILGLVVCLSAEVGLQEAYFARSRKKIRRRGLGHIQHACGLVLLENPISVACRSAGVHDVCSLVGH